MCRGCREQLAEYAMVSEGLALKAPGLEPPRSLEAGVFKRIRAEQKAAATVPAASLGGWPQFWMRLGPVFAVVGVVMTGMAFLYMQKAAEFRNAAAAYSGIDHGKLQQLMTHSGVHTVNLKAAGDKGCSGSITCAEGSRFMLLSVDKLHRCPLGRVYVVWAASKSGEVKRLASFVPAGEDPQNILVEMEKGVSVSGLKEIKVTLQQKTTDLPDGEIYLASNTSL
jgi:hypothetical protein